MASSTSPLWEAPKFSCNAPNQAEELKLFYTHAVDFLKALDIDPEEEDQPKEGWHQVKMMSEGEDCQALQTLLDNSNITSKDQCTPIRALNVIQTIIKEDEHIWHYRDEFLNNCRQQPDEFNHALNMSIMTLIINCKLAHPQIKETLKHMLLQHAIKYHKARDMIHLQNEQNNTYQSLLSHYKLLKSRCEQFQKAEVKG